MAYVIRNPSTGAEELLVTRREYAALRRSVATRGHGPYWTMGLPVRVMADIFPPPRRSPLGKAWRHDPLRDWHVGPWGVVVSSQRIAAVGVANARREARRAIRARRRVARRRRVA